MPTSFSPKYVLREPYGAHHLTIVIPYTEDERMRPGRVSESAYKTTAQRLEILDRAILALTVRRACIAEGRNPYTGDTLPGSDVLDQLEPDAKIAEFHGKTNIV